MPNGAKNWCYTLNNYSETELADFRGLFERESPMVVFHRFGLEIGESGTPHLQGIVGFSKKSTMTQVKRIMKNDRLHLETTKSLHAAIKYCAKDGEFEDFGIFPTIGESGKRTDIDAFKEAVQNGMFKESDIIEHHSAVWAKHRAFAKDYIRLHRPVRSPEEHVLRPWQSALLEALNQDPTARHILFIVDKQGDSGKSWFADWYTYHHPDDSQVLEPAGTKDMALALKEDLRVVFMDCPKSKQGDYIQYPFLEGLKNGRVFSSKYESGMKYFGKMHVIVTMNDYPDPEKLSTDRYVIWRTYPDGTHDVETHGDIPVADDPSPAHTQAVKKYRGNSCKFVDKQYLGGTPFDPISKPVRNPPKESPRMQELMQTYQYKLKCEKLSSDYNK